MQPNTKMSSGQATFDLKAAREICSRIKGYEDPDGGNFADFQAAEMLPAALEEIERLQKALALKIEQHKGQAYVIGSYLGMLTDFNELNESQAKRITELEESLQRERAMAFSKIQRQRHAIARLSEAKRARGKALVEERAKRLVADSGDCPYRSPIKNQLISRCDKGIICDWCQCPIKDEWRDEAREQLRREDKL